MTTTILPTRNTEWGFFGTIARIETGPATEPTEAWAIAARRIAEATEASPEGVRDFLDIRHGRHFADDVANGLCTGAPLAAAIDAAIARWMGWRIDRKTSRDEGIPRRPSLPDRLGHPLPDPRRDAGLTPPPFDTSAARLRAARLGVVAGSGWSRSSQRRDDPMTKLSDTQAILLSAAAQRADGNLLPLPGSLRGGAAIKVVTALLARDLAREEVTDLQTRADAALNTIWRNEPDGRARPPAHHPGRARSHRHRSSEPRRRRRATPSNTGSTPASTRPASRQPARRRPWAGRAEEARPSEEGRCPTEPSTAPVARKTRDDTKQAQLIAMLRRKEGATIAQIVAATGWQPHTVRGAFAGALKKKLGLTVTSEKVEGGQRVYRIES